MVFLRRHAWAGLALLALFGCGRDFSTPWIATSPADSTSTVVGQKPDSSQTKPDTSKPVVVKPGPILIESLSAPDLRMDEGETKPARVTVLPADATSPLYEMTSSKPEVAEVTADGIRGAGKGTATITVHALDGSNKTTRFHVIVDAVIDICLLLPCLCGEKAKGKGKDKCDD
jgi:hypothetical protein